MHPSNDPSPAPGFGASPDCCPSEFCLDHVAVRIAAEGDQQALRELFQESIIEGLVGCQRQGYLKVVLDVRIERGPAIALFQKFGFKHGRTREIGGRKLLDFYIDLYSDPRG